MIDPLSEELLSFQQLAHWFPHVHSRSVAVSTLRYWALHGLRGLRLESTLFGGRRFTSFPAVQRFLDSLNSSYTPERP